MCRRRHHFRFSARIDMMSERPTVVAVLVSCITPSTPCVPQCHAVPDRHTHAGGEMNRGRQVGVERWNGHHRRFPGERRQSVIRRQGWLNDGRMLAGMLLLMDEGKHRRVLVEQLADVRGWWALGRRERHPGGEVVRRSQRGRASRLEVLREYDCRGVVDGAVREWRHGARKWRWRHR